MSYSNRSGTYAYFDSLHPEEAAIAAVRVIKNLKENPTPRGTELLRIFLRDVHKHLQEERTSTSDEYQPTIGKILVFLSKEIGKDNDGTVIYEGRYEYRPIAVKRLPRSHNSVVDREIKHLIESDQYHNIARYHGMESDPNFYYLAVERYDCTLDDLIQTYSAGSFVQCEVVVKDVHCSTTSVNLYKEDRFEKVAHNLGNVKLWEGNKARPSPLLLKLMRDMVTGLLDLHALNIIHRDLKPKSILIIKEISTFCAKLSDMGISRSLSGNKSYLTNHNTGCAATGWKAPEQLLCGQQTRAMDMFSLGCILFFCITQGKHPFGEPDERDRNIKSNNKKNMFLKQDFPEAFHLISRLLEADDPKKRPDANEVLQHPLFWNATKRISFLHDTSDSAENIDSELSKALNGTADTVFAQYSKVQNWCTKYSKVKNWYTKYSKVKNWYTEVGNRIMSHMCKYRFYNYSSVQDLLRLIRNMFNHYEQLPTDIQELVGSRYEGLDGFFTSKFPMLLIEVYDVVGKGYKEEERLRKYFKENL